MGEIENSVCSMTILSKDGPTSVFFAGKKRRDNSTKDTKKSKQNNYSLKKNKPKDHSLKNTIRLKSYCHSLKEVEQYICKKYGAVKLQPESIVYQEAYRNLKVNLIKKECPKLVAKEFPEFPQDRSSKLIEEFFKRLDEWYKEAEQIPNDKFPLDLQQYQIQFFRKKQKGTLNVSIEYQHSFISVDFSCSGKSLHNKICNIICDIYLYYGVTEKDIKERSERYRTLCSILMQYNEQRRVSKKKNYRTIWISLFFFTLTALILWQAKLWKKIFIS